MAGRRQLGWILLFALVMCTILAIPFWLSPARAATTADTGLVSPSIAVNATFANATNAFANDAIVATRTGTNTTQRYRGYTFNLPADAIVTGIEVRVDAWRSAGTCTPSLNIALSWDNETTYTAVRNTGALGTSDPEGTLVLGGSSDLWGHAWNVAEANANFVLSVQTQGLTGCTLSLDWIPVRIYYNQSTSTFTPTPTSVPARAVVINEVAWGGTAADANDEWIELYNTTAAPIVLTNWTLSDGGDINITLSGTIPAFGYFLLERTDNTTVSDILADQIYTGALSNTGETLTLRDPQGNVVDTANGDGGTWPAGTASPGFYSMERRNALTADSDTNWISNDGVHRNGLDANGNPINGTPKNLNSASFLLTATPTHTPTSTFTPTPTATRTAERLLITEVLYDGTMTDEGDEFIEIYNPNTFAVNLDGYKVGDEETRGGGEGMYLLPAYVLNPNAVVIIARNAAQFRNRFGFDPNFELVTTGALTDTLSVPDLTRYTTWATGSLAFSNSGDEALLLGPGDQLVDAVAWENSTAYASLGLYDDPNDKAKPNASEPQSLQRYGTDDRNNMIFDFLHGAPSPGTRVMPPTFPAPPPGATMPNGMFAFWGDIHSHSTASDGSGPPRMAYATARANGLHFYALTDHDAWLTLDGTEWNEIGNAAASANVDGTFVALRGFEYSHDSKGHLSVFGTTTWVSRDDPNYDTLPEFYAWLAAQPNAIAQFNHPDPAYGGTFDNFAFNAGASSKIFMIEVGNNGNGYVRYEPQYPQSLSKGWRVAPTNNSDNHWLTWGSDTPHRTGIIAPSLTQADVLDAFRARRVFATEDKNLAIALQSNGAWMGSTITTKPLLNFTVTLIDPDAEPVTLSLYDNGTQVRTQSFTGSLITWNVSINGNPSHYYYVRAVQADGDIAYTAPLWTDNTPLPTAIPPTEAPREKRWDLGPVSVDTARNTDLYRYVEVEACVTVPPGVFSDRYIYLHDATGGIKVYMASRVGNFPAMQLADRVAVRGRVEVSSGEREIDVQDAGTIQLRGSCGSVAPVRYATGKIEKNLFGWLVEVTGNVVSVTPPYEFVLNDGTGDLLIYIDANTGIRLTNITRGQTVRVAGIVSQSRNRVAVLPRYTTDLTILQNVATPTRPRTPTGAAPTRTATRVLTPTLVPTKSAQLIETPTRQVVLAPPRLAPVESPPIQIDAQAIAVAGATTSAMMGFAFFALAFVLWRRQK